MRKKTGILTFHNALSYGAALQAYALQQFLNRCGVENDIIDYRCDFIEKNYKKLIRIVKGKELKSFVGSLVQMGNKRKSLALSAAFRQKHMKLSRSVERADLPQLVGEYDRFVAGSDQVWSPDCAGFDKTYFLDFAKPGQKYSYAASLGCPKIPEDKREAYRQLLSDFNSLSLREESGAEQMRSLGFDARVDIDPTLLLSAKEWDGVCAEPVYKQPYIFLFSVHKPRKMIAYAAQLGREKGLPVYYLNNKHLPTKGIRFAKPVGADGFVSLIKNAEYVVTNSFHGSVFAILYHKKFVMEHETQVRRNNRSEELLRVLKIENREIGEGLNPLPDEEIDWKTVDEILEVQRQRAAEYIGTIRD